jgi:CelD/BcsL family acetyltransferase involved in cellulose biosynthesis
VELTVITEWSALARWRDRWDALAAASPTRSIFQTFEWHDAWWRSFGSQYAGLRVLLAHEGERLLGVAPLMIERRRVNLVTERVLCFIGTPNRSSDYADFIAAAGHGEAAVAAFAGWIRSSGDWTLLDLLHVPGHSPHLAVARRALAPLGRLDEYVQYDAPARLLGTDPKSDAEAVNKKSLKRHFNALKKSGEVEFVHLGADAEEHLELFYQQHNGRRALAGGEGLLFDQPAQREFYRSLARALAPLDRLRFAVVRLNGKPLAFHFGFEYDGVFTWYKPSFDAAEAHRSPGEVLIKYLLEYCIARGVKEFDFTVGDEAFKYRFANEIRKVNRLRVFRRPAGWAMMRLRRFAGRLRRSTRRGKDKS